MDFTMTSSSAIHKFLLPFVSYRPATDTVSPCLVHWHPASFSRCKDLRFNDTKRANTPNAPTTVAEVHAAEGVNTLDERSPDA